MSESLQADMLMVLSAVAVGQTVRLVRVEAGHGLRHRLAALGLLPNAMLTVLRNQGRGQLIVHVKNSKIVLGRGMAHKILVRPDAWPKDRPVIASDPARP